MKKLTLIFLLFCNFPVQGQDFVESLLELFEVHLNKKTVAEDSSRYPAKLVLSPVIAYEPATSWGVGIGAKVLFKFKGSTKETRTSNLPISLLYTLNNQIIFSSGYTIFSNEEKWSLRGNLGFSRFPQAYFGRGNLTSAADEEIFSFTNYLIEPILLRKVYKKLFVGGGIRYNIIANTRLEEEGQLILEQPSGYNGSRSVGVEVVAVWDNRDNVLNATEGSFIEFKQGFYGKIAGGTNNFRFNTLDARTYWQPFPNRKDVFAFQFYSRFSWADVPISELSLLGGAESSRGYQEGRYRDFNVLSSQLEYRWHAFERLGFVAFTGVGEVFRLFDEVQLNNLKYSAGVGIRLKIVEAENLNIRFDYGFGFGHETANGYYLGIAEAF